MRRYFFHLYDHTPCIDDVGELLADYAEVHARAVKSARDLMAEAVKHGLLNLSYRIEVVDEDGQC
jgi:hypothetical protein